LDRDPGEAINLAGGIRLAGCDDEYPCYVVGAVAVLESGLSQTGVFEGAPMICQL
jgi:hypothetical protein